MREHTNEKNTGDLMKEHMENLDETIEAILSCSKTDSVKKMPQRQSPVMYATSSGRSKTVLNESGEIGNKTADGACDEGYEQADMYLSRNSTDRACSRAEDTPEYMDKSLRFTNFGGARIRERLFESAFSSDGSNRSATNDDIFEHASKNAGIMSMKPFGSSELKRSGESVYECGRGSFADLEEILGLDVVDLRKSRNSGQIFALEGKESDVFTVKSSSETTRPQTSFSSGPLPTAGIIETHSAGIPTSDVYGCMSNGLQACQTGSERWLRHDLQNGYTRQQETDSRRHIFGTQRDHSGHTRSGDKHILHHHHPDKHAEIEQCGFDRAMAERPLGRQQPYRPHLYETAKRHKHLRASDNLLFRNPIGSLDQLKSQVYYRIKKRRRLNSGTWNLGDNLSMIHPARLSSLEFVSGCGAAGSPYVPACTSLPLILNSGGEMAPENIGVAQNFKKVTGSIDFNNVTVFQLKQLMRDYGLNHAGKKNDLIDRIKSTLQEIDCLFKGYKKGPRDIRRESPEEDKKEEIVYDKFFF